MSEARYPILSVIWEDRIRRGEYPHGFPSQRSLQREFSASAGTVSKALAILQRRKILRASKGAPRNGFVINEAMRQRSRGVIGLVSGSEGMSNSPLIRYLGDLFRDDGFEVETMTFQTHHFIQNPERLFPKRFAGLVFAFSSLTVETALYLGRAKIPFIAGNMLPVLSDLSYVEHDVVGAWRKLIGMFHARGYRKIGMFFPGTVESICDHYTKIWRKLAREFGLQPSGCDHFAPDWTADRADSTVRFLHFINTHGDWPEVLICWYGLSAAMIDKWFSADKIGVPPQMPLVFTGDTPFVRPNCFLLRKNDYIPLMDAMYWSLRERMAAPEAPPMRRLVEYPIKFIQPLPEWLRRSGNHS